MTSLVDKIKWHDSQQIQQYLALPSFITYRVDMTTYLKEINQMVLSNFTI